MQISTKTPTRVSIEYFFITRTSALAHPRVYRLEHERPDHVVHDEHEHAREHDRRRGRDADALRAVDVRPQMREITLEAAYGRDNDREYERLHKAADDVLGRDAGLELVEIGAR